MNSPILTLYSKKNCPLCDQAKDLLVLLQREKPFTLVEIDIYADSSLLERFGLMIPVIEYQGEIIQYGQVDIDEVSHYLG